MSPTFECRFEWQDSTGMRDEALARTFARLQVNVGDHCVTHALDRHTRSVVEGVHVSLLPLVVWIVDAWWVAFHELSRTRLIWSIRDAHGTQQRLWHRHHGWWSAREGFCIPEIVFSRGDGDSVRVDWFRSPTSSGTAYGSLEFIDCGSMNVPMDEVRDELGRLVEGVLARCQGLDNPVVNKIRARWGLIRGATDEERLVCERAARLGLDAYDEQEVDDPLVELLRRRDTWVGDSMLNDVLDVADEVNASTLDLQIHRLRECLSTTQLQDVDCNALRLEKARQCLAGVQGLPYERGYERARILRQDVLGLGGESIADDLDQAIAASLLPSSRVAEDDDTFIFPGINALAKMDAHKPFVVSRHRHSSANGRFDKARALYTLISSDVPRLITASRDGEQQASRAFAAELLAPEAYLRRRIKSRFVSSDETREIALSLHVSPRLVEHQIENHNLAEITDA